MFTSIDLSDDLARLKDAAAPEARFLVCEQEFETMPTAWLYELALITDDLEPLSYPDSWVPADAAPAATRTTGRDPAIGMPDDGSIAWTRQTDPPLVLEKPRAEGLPDGFRDFLRAEAILEVGTAYPETPVCFFREDYRTIHDHVGDPTRVFQVAAALRTGWIGLQTRSRFRDWSETMPRLHDPWQDAGDRLADRVESIPSLIADGQLGFADATELACSAFKHDIDPPAPYAALDVEAFIEQGAPFAIQWIRETVPEAMGG